MSVEDKDVVSAVVADLKRQGVDVENRVEQFAVVRHPSDFYLLEPHSHARRPNQVHRFADWHLRATTRHNHSFAAWRVPPCRDDAPQRLYLQADSQWLRSLRLVFSFRKSAFTEVSHCPSHNRAPRGTTHFC
jgi:hypothetical protein